MTTHPTIKALIEALGWRDVQTRHILGLEAVQEMEAGRLATSHYAAARRWAAAGEGEPAAQRQALGDAWYQRARYLREQGRPRPDMRAAAGGEAEIAERRREERARWARGSRPSTPAPAPQSPRRPGRRP